MGMVQRFAVLPGLHLLEELRRRGIEPHGDDVVHELHAMALDGSFDPTGRLEAVAERLVQEDVLPGGGGLFDPASLVARIAADRDDVDPRIVDQLRRSRRQLDSQRLR
jgi:hypothetical protein